MECPFCLEGWIGEEKCEHCDDDGILECRGDSIDLIEEEDPGQVFELARAIIYARDRDWIPTEYGAQPARFINAFERFLRHVLLLMEEVREQHRKGK